VSEVDDSGEGFLEGGREEAGFIFDYHEIDFMAG
jgi:hypothetical protein